MRLFIALDIPREGKSILSALREDMRKACRGRYVGDDQFHITLHFLGDVPPSQLPILCDLLDAVSVRNTFALTMSGTGAFSSKDGYTAYARIGHSQALAALVADLESALEQHGFPKETKPFRGHVTLGRAVAQALPYPEYAPFDFTADHITLYESRLGPGGPAYLSQHRSILQHPTASNKES